MHLFRLIMTIFFSGTALLLMTYQFIEIVHAFIDFIFQKYS